MSENNKSIRRNFASNDDWVKKLPDDMRTAYEHLEKDLSGPEKPISRLGQPDEGLDEFLE